MIVSLSTTLCVHHAAGDAPICDPKTYYQCVAITKWQYIKDNEAAKCNCPRQCRRLTYQYSISQAQLSTFVVNFAKTVFQLNETVDEIRGDHCSLEVGKQYVCLLAQSSKHGMCINDTNTQ